MEIEKSKVLIQFLLIFRQFGDVLSFLYARRLRGYTATTPYAIHQQPLLHREQDEEFSSDLTALCQLLTNYFN